MAMFKALVLCLILDSFCNGNVFLQNPSGSNNRLNEEQPNEGNNNDHPRKNKHRCFDSQNDEEGGYNVGEEGTQKSQQGDEDQKQYRMKYYQSGQDSGKDSYLRIEWTSQHGCANLDHGEGGEHRTNCDYILQYMCQPLDSTDIRPSDWKLRNGKNVNTPDYKDIPANDQANTNRKPANYHDTCLQEPYQWFDKCIMRDRNTHLETLDQILSRNSSTNTRQNPKGERYGYECPEERDYYPYWHPTPWTDIAVVVGSGSQVQGETACSYYKEASHNTQTYHECIETWPGSTSTTRKHYSTANNQGDCDVNGGTWTELSSFIEKASDKGQGACTGSGEGWEYKWAIPSDTLDGTSSECLVVATTPDCKVTPYTRPNHLGNTEQCDDGDDIPQSQFYNWRIPHFPSGKSQRCLLRIRYNVSTSDNLDVLETKPEVIDGCKRFSLAMDTKQYGRTFQDRSHVFELHPRTTDECCTGKIHNLNVRGRRGNIVQTFPATEYDFVPTKLDMTADDCVHIQWTGSNSQPNNQAGQGRDQTDRHNFVQTYGANLNYPIGYSKTYPAFRHVSVNDQCYCLYIYQNKDFDNNQNDHVNDHVNQNTAKEKCAGLHNNLPDKYKSQMKGLELFELFNPETADLEYIMEELCPEKDDNGNNNEYEWKHKELWTAGNSGNKGYVLKCGNEKNDRVYAQPPKQNARRYKDNANQFICAAKSSKSKNCACGEACGSKCRITQVKDPGSVSSIWEGAKFCRLPGPNSPAAGDAKDAEIIMASSCFFKSKQELDNRGEELNDELDNAPASCLGIVAKFKPETYHYMCTRNNNFSNRSQLGKIVVAAGNSTK